MDCTGLCKTFTIEDCTELQQDCLDWMRIVTDSWPCNRHLNPTNPITMDKILTKSNFLINVNVVRFRDFSGSVYAHFPLQTGCPGMVPPPPTVLQWLLVWILHREIIAYISELRAQKRLVGLEFDGNSPSWV